MKLQEDGPGTFEWMKYQAKFIQTLGPEVYLRSYFRSEKWALNDQQIWQSFKAYFELSFKGFLILKDKIEINPLESDGEMPKENDEFKEWYSNQSEDFKKAIRDYKQRIMKIAHQNKDKIEKLRTRKRS